MNANMLWQMNKGGLRHPCLFEVTSRGRVVQPF